MTNPRFAGLFLVYAGTALALRDAFSAATAHESGLRGLHSRAQKPITIPISNSGGNYIANITVGTPLQNLQLLLSGTTGDVWVNANGTYCASADPSPCTGGVYNANQSSTYQFLNSNLYESFSDGTFYLSGDWAKDDFTLGTTSVDALRFAAAYNTTESPGVLGLGYEALESSSAQYPNLLARLKQSGLTNINAHSIWANQIAADRGELTFGGVDTNKFYGSLETMSITEDEGARLNLDKMEISYNGQKTTLYDSPISVVLDVGLGSMTLPPEITKPLFASFGVSCDPDCFVDPLQLTNTSTLDFVFGAKTISVTMDELVVAYNSTASRWASDVGDPVSDGSVYYLGNVFLRSAYAVFDWDNQEISLAQSNFDSTTRKIVALPAGGVQAASLTGVPSSAATSSAAATSAASITSSQTHTPTSIASATSTSTSTSSGLSSGAKAGIGVGVTLGALILLGAIIYFFIMRHRRTSTSRGRKSHYDEPEQIPMKYSDSPRQELDTDAQRHEMDDRPVHKRPAELEGPHAFRYELDTPGNGGLDGKGR